MNSNTKNYIISSLGWLKALGFKEVSHVEEVVFKNDYIILSFTFFKSTGDQSFFVSVKKNGENKSFFMNEYLENVGKDKVLFTSGESEEMFMDRNLDVLKSLIKNELRELVAGKIWIDVPRDYMGYR